MKNWIGGFITATLLVYSMAVTLGSIGLYEETLELKSQLKKEEEE